MSSNKCRLGWAGNLITTSPLLTKYRTMSNNFYWWDPAETPPNSGHTKFTCLIVIVCINHRLFRPNFYFYGKTVCDNFKHIMYTCMKPVGFEEHCCEYRCKQYCQWYVRAGLDKTMEPDEFQRAIRCVNWTKRHWDYPDVPSVIIAVFYEKPGFFLKDAIIYFIVVAFW